MGLAQDLATCIDRNRVAMLTSIDDQGGLQSRPMFTLRIEEDGTLLFLTDDPSLKTFQVRHNKHVNLSYENMAEDFYLSLSGNALILKDPTKINELWEPQFARWFPLGPTDPELCVLAITPCHGEIWLGEEHRVFRGDADSEASDDNEGALLSILAQASEGLASLDIELTASYRDGQRPYPRHIWDQNPVSPNRNK